jgi:hypothetical protein
MGDPRLNCPSSLCIPSRPWPRPPVTAKGFPSSEPSQVSSPLKIYRHTMERHEKRNQISRLPPGGLVFTGLLQSHPGVGQQHSCAPPPRLVLLFGLFYSYCIYFGQSMYDRSMSPVILRLWQWRRTWLQVIRWARQSEVLFGSS